MDIYLNHRLDVHDVIVTVAYDKHIAEEQRIAAQTLKQSRWWREELDHDHKKDGKEQKKGKGKGKDDDIPAAE